jgi:hypothetical protein
MICRRKLLAPAKSIKTVRGVYEDPLPGPNAKLIPASANDSNQPGILLPFTP